MAETPTMDLGFGKKCSPWKDHSRCTKDITDQLHTNKTWYKMDYNHCPSRPMSTTGRSMFTQDLCFYECSPNVGLWLVKTTLLTSEDGDIDMNLHFSHREMETST